VNRAAEPPGPTNPSQAVGKKRFRLLSPAAKKILREFAEQRAQSEAK
jgi:hypothetical protein